MIGRHELGAPPMGTQERKTISQKSVNDSKIFRILPEPFRKFPTSPLKRYPHILFHSKDSSDSSLKFENTFIYSKTMLFSSVTTKFLSRSSNTAAAAFRRNFHASSSCMEKLNVEGLAKKVDLDGKNVLVRVDLNVPLAKVRAKVNFIPVNLGAIGVERCPCYSELI